jgi:hypothetical protein
MHGWTSSVNKSPLVHSFRNRYSMVKSLKGKMESETADLFSNLHKEIRFQLFYNATSKLKQPRVGVGRNVCQ